MLLKILARKIKGMWALLKINRPLLKINPDGLVEKAALEVLILGLPGIVLEAEETGRITFLDGDLEIARRVKEGQLFAFAGIRIGLADPFYDLIPFEDDAKAAALSPFFEFLVVSESINVSAGRIPQTQLRKCSGGSTGLR